MSSRSRRGRQLGAAVSGALCTFAVLVGTTPIAGAESRGYVMSMVHTATYSNTDTCPKGGNGGPEDFRKRRLLAQGLTEAEAAKLLAEEQNQNQDQQQQQQQQAQAAQAANAGQQPAPAGGAGGQRRGGRGNTPNVGNFPTAFPDPNIELASGQFAFGFNLDGKEQPGSFEDPVTHERGVDNNMWRAIGCFTVYNVRQPVRPYSEDIAFDTAIDSMPAWLISVSGENLDQDGEVTVTFDRALNVAMRNTYGGIMSGASYTVDPDPRFHWVLKGRIKDRVLLIEGGGDFAALGESQWYPWLRFSNTHLRLKMAPDGGLDGLIGGYQPWKDFFYFLAIRGEGTGQVDLSGAYYAMKKIADGPADPLTGERNSISAAYRFQAVPAFVTTTSGKVVARSVGAGPAVNGPAENENAGADSKK